MNAQSHLYFLKEKRKKKNLFRTDSKKEKKQNSTHNNSKAGYVFVGYKMLN